MRILLVEDDDLIAEGLGAGLRAHGLAVDRVASAAHGAAALAAAHWDLLILDLGLPDEDGMAFLRRLRAQGEALPVLVLTARDALESRVAGLRGGADDYVVKPFDLEEVVARVHALLRRAAGRAEEAIEHGELRVLPASGEVFLRGDPVHVSRRELDVLLALLHARGRIVTPERLKDVLYGLGEDVESNALNVHIHHLRRKLGAAAIETVRGMGYRIGSVGP